MRGLYYRWAGGGSKSRVRGWSSLGSGPEAKNGLMNCALGKKKNRDEREIRWICETKKAAATDPGCDTVRSNEGVKGDECCALGYNADCRSRGTMMILGNKGGAV